jgi:hypothetical protein
MYLEDKLFVYSNPALLHGAVDAFKQSPIFNELTNSYCLADVAVGAYVTPAPLARHRKSVVLYR